MKAAFDANRAGFIQFGPEVLSVVYGAEEAAEETNALMNYFLFFPRSFFTSSHTLPLTRGNFRLREGPFLLAAILGIFATL